MVASWKETRIHILGSFFLAAASFFVITWIANAQTMSTANIFRGGTLSLSYDATSDECVNSVKGWVSIGGVVVPDSAIDYWYACLGTIALTVPATAVSGDVWVTLGDGAQYKVGNLRIEDDPVITSVSPAAYTPGAIITVDGYNFGENFYTDTLYFGDQPITLATWNNNRITFSVPAFVTGAARVQLRKGINGAGFSPFVASDYVLVQPVITGVSNIYTAAGLDFSIFGSGFKKNFPPGSGTYSLEVSIGGTPLPISAYKPDGWTESSITVKTPVSLTTSGTVAVKLTDDITGKSVNAEGPTVFVLQPSANDPLSVTQQYLQQAHIDDAWQYTHGSRKVVVAVIDSGVDTNNIDLTDNIWTNVDEKPGNGVDDDKNGYVDDTHGYNFVANLPELTPYDGHGTMVAGIIGAVGNNATGITGINWQVQIMPIIALDRNGGSLDLVKKAIRYAADNGADIINLSLGGSGWTTDYRETLTDDISYAFNKGILIVAAAGNGDAIDGPGRNLDVNPNSPVCNDGGKNMVLGVGSVDLNNVKSQFSDYGHNCVDLMAPGENIVSLSPKVFSSAGVETDQASGTSFAAPIVSGVAALLKALYPNMTNVDIRDRLLGTADAIDSLNPTFAGRLGAGFINALNAVKEPFTAAPGQAVQPVVSSPADSSLVTRLSGRILLQVQQKGEAWYLNPDDGKRYYMKDGSVAFSMMRKFALGITNSDIAKIPIHGDNTLGDAKLIKRMRGKILLQVEQGGDAWYVNPVDSKRYFMGKPEDAYMLMRNLGLGITDHDLNQIPVGSLQ